jgi:hypothetical protein
MSQWDSQNSALEDPYLPSQKPARVVGVLLLLSVIAFIIAVPIYRHY